MGISPPIIAQPLRRVSLAEALRAVFAHPIRLAPVERIPLTADAAGRIVAADISASEDVPPFTRSSVDGFAVIAADLRGASPTHPARLTIAGDVKMGAAAPHAIGSGEAVRVPTGGALPPGATGVIKVEDASETDGVLEVHDAQGSEEHITQRGGDVKRGDALARRGDVLTAASSGMLAGAGVSDVQVFIRPPVALLVSGDELVPPGGELREGEIRDINGISLAACLRAMGMEPRVYPRVPDRKEDLERALKRALGECIAVVISGGSSVGERDYTPAVVAAAGKPGVIVHGIRAKPGRPTMLGIVGDQPVIGLPGNPVSALVMLETLGKPILLKLFDKTEQPLTLRARLQGRIERSADLEYLVPVRITSGGEGLEATPLVGTSAQMHILGFADALVRVPAGRGAVETGAWIDAVPLTRSIGVK